MKMDEIKLVPGSLRQPLKTEFPCIDQVLGFNKQLKHSKIFRVWREKDLKKKTTHSNSLRVLNHLAKNLTSQTQLKFKLKSSPTI